MKVYKTNITEGMCPDWDKLDVAREFIANALDNEDIGGVSELVRKTLNIIIDKFNDRGVKWQE